MRKIAIILFFLLANNQPAQYDLTTIHGKVFDETGEAIPGVNVVLKELSKSTTTDADGNYIIENIPKGKYTLVASFTGYKKHEISVSANSSPIRIDIKMEDDILGLEEIVVSGYQSVSKKEVSGAVSTVRARDFKDIEVESAQSILQGRAAGVEIKTQSGNNGGIFTVMVRGAGSVNTANITYPQSSGNNSNRRYSSEEYDKLEENPFTAPIYSPLSTFSIDVDVAAYSNIRRFLNQGQLPNPDAVRIEEMINYFNYDYDGPSGEHPFNVVTEVANAPWNEHHKLIHIGIQGKKMQLEELPPNNLVFLLDVSGSMGSHNKLPLLKKAFGLLTQQLRKNDRVAIVVYAGNSGLVLESTPGNKKQKIIESLERLYAGGSTAGAAGIQLAYKVAQENYIEGGNNRVILATDGDFNVGVSKDDDLVSLIEQKRDNDIFLTVLGFGMGNYKDSKMEKLADHGNGNYAYIDNIREAKKVLVTELGGTLFTIAKDVKIQVEFNPENVMYYRLIGYENRLLEAQDFNDDKKDAGELGAGHSVTALYEVIPAGLYENGKVPSIDPLKYQRPKAIDSNYKKELLTLKLRYKEPKEKKSKLLSSVVNVNSRKHKPSSNMTFSASVAAFGMLLKNSSYKGSANYDLVLRLAKESKGNDLNGYRSEFIRLVETAKLHSTTQAYNK